MLFRLLSPRLFFPRLLFSLLVAASLHAALAQDAAQPEAASAWHPKPSLYAPHYMAVTANPYATEAAVEILALGGTAVDAAIAAQLVLNLVEPQSSGIGGGGFMLYLDAARHRVHAYDGRETAPAAATPRRFLDADGKPMRFGEALASAKSVGVPGIPALLAMAHERHGRLRWQRLIKPALHLAEEGFLVSRRLNALLARDPLLRANAEARLLYYRADGAPLPVGARLKNPAFASVLRALAQSGVKAFYRGAIAEDIVRAAGPARGGDLAAGDLASYRAIERAPLCRPYRAYTICGMPPPSAGAISTLQLLGLLERTRFHDIAPGSPLAVHLFTEAARLAYADRRRYLGDPDFVSVPSEAMLDARYLDVRARLISERRSLDVAPPGNLPGRRALADDMAPELPSTSHLSIVDAEGNAVAFTTSIEAAFGSRIAVNGFLLNNQLTDFSFQPESDGRPAANRVQGGKRPLSSMSPTLVFDAQHRLYAITGSPGGTQIINYVAQFLTALLDWRMSIEQALAQPHFGSRNGPTELEQGSAAMMLAAPLRALGHRVVLREMTSGLHAIVRDGAGWRGAADPRREGSAGGG